MIKTLLISLIVLCGLGFFPLALAQEASPGTVTPTPSPVEYALPYPGLLPNHPLFFLKMMRDSVLTALISDPVRKVEFSQLMTDKYMHMGVVLTQKQNKKVALDTFKQVAQLIERTKQDVYKLPPTNADEVGNIKLKFKKSLEKYEEIILTIQPQFDTTGQNQLTLLLTVIGNTRAELE